MITQPPDVPQLVSSTHSPRQVTALRGHGDIRWPEPEAARIAVQDGAEDAGRVEAR